MLKRRTFFRYADTERYIVGLPCTEELAVNESSGESARNVDLPPVSLRLHGGGYDIGRKEELRRELDSIEPDQVVVLDFSLTEHIDCFSIGLMIAQLKAWNRAEPGTTVRLRNVKPRLARIFRMLGLEHEFVVELNRLPLFHRGVARH